jgi:hypothetical protein
MSNNTSMNLNLERLNRLNEKLNNVSIIQINFQTFYIDNNYYIIIINKLQGEM